VGSGRRLDLILVSNGNADEVLSTRIPVWSFVAMNWTCFSRMIALRWMNERHDVDTRTCWPGEQLLVRAQSGPARCLGRCNAGSRDVSRFLRIRARPERLIPMFLIELKGTAIL
jgi:hypothetical protein